MNLWWLRPRALPGVQSKTAKLLFDVFRQLMLQCLVAQSFPLFVRRRRF